MHVLGKPFQSIPTVVDKAGVYPRGEHLNCAIYVTLLANIRLGWKVLPSTNTLAYMAHSLITATKSKAGAYPSEAPFMCSIHSRVGS